MKQQPLSVSTNYNNKTENTEHQHYQLRGRQAYPLKKKTKKKKKFVSN
jgi:hypothetical protein